VAPKRRSLNEDEYKEIGSQLRDTNWCCNRNNNPPTNVLHGVLKASGRAGVMKLIYNKLKAKAPFYSPSSSSERQPIPPAPPPAKTMLTYEYEKTNSWKLIDHTEPPKAYTGIGTRKTSPSDDPKNKSEFQILNLNDGGVAAYKGLTQITAAEQQFWLNSEPGWDIGFGGMNDGSAEWQGVKMLGVGGNGIVAL
jgi:hypothetical protein